MTLPDVESMVRAFLAPVVTPAKVSTLVPNPRPDELVRAFRTGGAAVNRVLDRAQVTVTCSALTEVRASELASKCRSALLGAYTAMPLVRGVSETGGLYSDPDPSTGSPRYTFTVELSVRASRP